MNLPEPPEFTFGPVALRDLVRYAGASGDFNRLHYDAEFARSGGMPGVIAHGMLSAGLLASFISSWFGPGTVRRFRVRFHAPVVLGDVLTARGSVDGQSTIDDVPSATLSVALLRQTGEQVVSGTATVVTGLPS